jgi:hypothetical protein
VNPGFLAGVGEHLGDVGELASEHDGGALELVSDRATVGLCEDRADRGCDHLRARSRHAGEHVAHERTRSVAHATPIITKVIAFLSPR